MLSIPTLSQKLKNQTPASFWGRHIFVRMTEKRAEGWAPPLIGRKFRSQNAAQAAKKASS
jgi:hypothetical protein